MNYPFNELVSTIINNDKIIKNPTEQDITGILTNVLVSTKTSEEFSIEPIMENIEKQYRQWSENIKMAASERDDIDSKLLQKNLENNIERERMFITKVTYFIDKAIRSAEWKNLVVLLDIDDTIIYRQDGIDILRPSIIPLLEHYKTNYSDKISFGILSSRGRDYCMPDSIKQYINTNYVYSTRDGFLLGEELLFKSRLGVEQDSDAKQYLIDKWVWGNYQNYWHYTKSYALLKIQDHYSETKIIAIDDYFGDGRLPIHNHWWLGVKDCMFGCSGARMLTSSTPPSHTI